MLRLQRQEFLVPLPEWNRRAEVQRLAGLPCGPNWAKFPNKD